MRSLTEANIFELLSYEDAIQCVQQAHLDLAKGKATNATRVRVRQPGMSLHSLSASSATLKLAGAKIYGATRSGMEAHVLLFSAETGKLVATLEANQLGRLRTAAAAVVGSTLQKWDTPATLAIVGAGFQAEGVARAFSVAPNLEIESIRISSRTQERAEKLCKKLSADCSFKVEPYSLVSEACNDAGIIVTATTTKSPVIKDSDIGAAKYIAALGSNSLHRCELPGRVITTASQVIVDTLDTAKAEAGDLLPVIESGHLVWEQVKELGIALLEPKVEASPGSPLLFSSQGIGIQDLYLAALAYERST